MSGLEASALVAVVAFLLFTGASIYINLVEHPARLECGTALAATVFGPSYRRAAVMQATLALVATAAGVAAAATGGSPWWLAGAVLVFFVVPFTFVGIMGTNRRLLDPELDRDADETRDT